MKIVKSLIVIVAVAALAAGATTAIFSSRATLDDNNFSTGLLEIRIDWHKEAPGFTFAKAQPGDVFTETFTIINYGSHEVGIPAKELAVTSVMTSGESALFNKLMVDLYASGSEGACSLPDPVKGCLVYSGPLSGLDGSSSTDILDSAHWTTQPNLITRRYLNMTMDVSLPVDADNSLMNKNAVFDIYFDAYNPHR